MVFRNGISGKFGRFATNPQIANQLNNYFKEINNISGISYSFDKFRWFNKTEGITAAQIKAAEDEIKMAFQQIYQNSEMGIFAEIIANPNLRKDIFGEGVEIDIDDFRDLVNNLSSQLFDFIKVQ